ncbi:hypothetical protein L208DRAFT_1337863, partial [Tricholoma matsutake]
CDKCLRVFHGEEVWVVVIDGVTVGHPCCGVHNCFKPLENQHKTFCRSHEMTEGRVCTIKGYTQLWQAQARVCSNPKHLEVEHIYIEHGQAQIQLKEHLERACISHLNDSVAEEHVLDDVADDEAEQEIEIAVTIQSNACQADSVCKHLQAQFGHRRTHNEELIVVPCGIILAQQTFYGAEGVSSVANFMKNVFCNGPKPKHIFFNNNCTLKRMVEGDEFFSDIGLTVDVFHWSCKHLTRDTFCQQHCNPYCYPELQNNDRLSWYFNSSIAEQTNLWFRGYHAICWEMGVDRFNFFLDKMIYRQNEDVWDKLVQQN